MTENELRLGLQEDRSTFVPGDEINGAAGWKLNQSPESAEVRLFWHTEGKGSTDVTLVDTVTFENPRPEEARPFKFRAPGSPYSFSGKLISVIWSLELVLKPGDESTRQDIVISSNGQEVLTNPDESA